MKYSELIKLLKKNGCQLHRHGANHDIWRAPNGQRRPVPRHKGEIANGTVNQILKGLGIK